MSGFQPLKARDVSNRRQAVALYITPHWRSLCGIEKHTYKYQRWKVLLLIEALSAVFWLTCPYVRRTSNAGVSICSADVLKNVHTTLINPSLQHDSRGRGCASPSHPGEISPNITFQAENIKLNCLLFCVKRKKDLLCRTEQPGVKKTYPDIPLTIK